MSPVADDDTAVRTQGPGPRVMVVSRPDSASLNIARAVGDRSAWEPTEARLDGHTVERLVDAPYGDPDATPVYMATIDDWHIRREGLGEDIAAALGMPLEAILVLSRHRAASGKESFTAHPVGNPTTADAGGRPGVPTPTHPHLLSAAFRALRTANDDAPVPHEVTLEATHHGPWTRVPVVFIEIGSDDRHWDVPAAGDVVGEAALRAVLEAPTEGPRTILGVGGGHYAPRFNALLAETGVSVGHMLASYHWSDHSTVAPEVVDAFIRASGAPGRARPDGVYVDRKSLPSAHRRAVLDLLDDLGLPRVRTKDIKAWEDAAAPTA